MTDADRYRLISGPYASPAWQRGRIVLCEYRDCDVRVTGWHHGPIPWPVGRRAESRGGGAGLIIADDLARAVRTESEIAVAHWWGVSPVTVYHWRRAIGVPAVNDGTARLYREYAPEKVAGECARSMLATPEVRARAAAAISAGRRGQRCPDAVRAANRIAASNRPIGGAWAEAMRQSGRPQWTPADDAVLMSAESLASAASALGRSYDAAKLRAQRLRRRGLTMRWDTCEGNQ